MVKTVLIIGDAHVGNDGAVMPEEVWTDSDIPSKAKLHSANKTQLALLDKWQDMCDAYPNPDLLILNGDLIDGKNYKDSGLGTWTTDSALQAETLSDLVSWLKPRVIVGTSGSPYHCDRNPCVDSIAVKACIEKCGCDKEESKFRVGYNSSNVNNCRIHSMHLVTVSKSSWQYQTTPAAKALVMAKLNSDEYGHYDIVLKSHAHRFTYAGYNHSMAAILPCWKAYDPFGDTRIEFVNPSCGYVAFNIEADGTPNMDWDIFHFKQSELNPDVIV